MGMTRPSSGHEGLTAWLPYDARKALEHLRRPGLSPLERALAASVVVTALKQIISRGPVSAVWISLIEEALRYVPDLLEHDDLTG